MEDGSLPVTYHRHPVDISRDASSVDKAEAGQRVNLTRFSPSLPGIDHPRRLELLYPWTLMPIP